MSSCDEKHVVRMRKYRPRPWRFESPTCACSGIVRRQRELRHGRKACKTLLPSPCPLAGLPLDKFGSLRHLPHKRRASRVACRLAQREPQSSLSRTLRRTNSWDTALLPRKPNRFLNTQSSHKQTERQSRRKVVSLGLFQKRRQLHPIYAVF